MKKIFTLSLIGLFAFNVASAQDGEVLTNKNGVAMLPAAGDWGLGFNATPLLNYAGNMLGSSGTNSMSAAWDNSNHAISGKYFKDANTAYRGQLRIGFGSDKQDSLTTTSNNIVLGAGIEKRRGHGKIQGYYGGDVMIGLSGGKDSYEYVADFSTPRLTEDKQSGTFNFGLMGVIGVEYFVLPRMSIGAEYNWGLMYSSTGESETTTEVTEGNTETVKGSKSSSMSFDTGNNAGAIRLLFYF
tara:strand:+ start:292 stop:1017 length:726 start_codon:yes stop_codon:yes gene_type:complete